MRLLPFILLALAGCSDAPKGNRGDPIDCALDGGKTFAKVCTLEILAGTDRFILRRPDGGFRRLEGTPGGRWQLADGRDDLTVKVGLDVDRVEFAVAGDRYSLPLTKLLKRNDD